MNTFEQLIGAEIKNVLRLDPEESYDEELPLAVFLQLHDDGGLLIGNDYEEPSITLEYTTLIDMSYYAIDEYETFVNQLKAGDELKTLAGQTIKSIRVGRFHDDKLLGDNFIVRTGQFAGVIIEFYHHEKITFCGSNLGLRIEKGTELLFPNANKWQLK